MDWGENVKSENMSGQFGILFVLLLIKEVQLKPKELLLKYRLFLNIILICAFYFSYCQAQNKQTEVNTPTRHSFSMAFGYSEIMGLDLPNATNSYSLNYSYNLNNELSMGITSGINYYDKGHLVLPAVLGAWGEVNYRLLYLGYFFGASTELIKPVNIKLSVGPCYYRLRHFKVTGNFISGQRNATVNHYGSIGGHFDIKLSANLCRNITVGFLVRTLVQSFDRHDYFNGLYPAFFFEYQM